MKYKNDLVGLKFNKLLVVRGVRKGDRVCWDCVCDCGNTCTVRRYGLLSGRTKSCGCFRLESVTTHGLSKHPIYKSYINMRGRCLNEDNAQYLDYGGRGITVCEDWLNSFEKFHEDMSPTWKDGWEIDRIDNNGNYEPSNCRWVTRQQNVINRRGVKNSSSKYKGVHWVSSTGKWRVAVRCNKKSTHVGYFTDEWEAAQAYNVTAQQLFGEYANLNYFIEETT
jgi:hypothetical protein